MSGDIARGSRGRGGGGGGGERERRYREGEGSESSSSSSLPRDTRYSLADRHAVPHPRNTRMHASQRIRVSRYTPTRLIFNPLDSVNACGRPLPSLPILSTLPRFFPARDVDSRPRFRVIGIRLLESCAPLYPPPLSPAHFSLAPGRNSHHRARFSGNMDYAPVSVISSGPSPPSRGNQSDRRILF